MLVLGPMLVDKLCVHRSVLIVPALIVQYTSLVYLLHKCMHACMCHSVIVLSVIVHYVYACIGMT